MSASLYPGASLGPCRAKHQRPRGSLRLLCGVTGKDAGPQTRLLDVDGVAQFGLELIAVEIFVQPDHGVIDDQPADHGTTNTAHRSADGAEEAARHRARRCGSADSGG